jgi:hypothetical protein
MISKSKGCLNMLRSKFYRVATSGKTVDGRDISPQQIDQMATNYDPKKYGARIWMEHLRSLMPDGAFKAYGDVIALKSETGSDGKRVLLAQIAPTPELVEINRKGQKVFSSVEINPNFSDTNEAYLMGLAVTDSPASTGTEMIKFCLENKDKFSHGSELEDAIFSDALEVENLEFTEVDDTSDGKTSFADKIKAMFTAKDKQTDQNFADMRDAVMECATAVSDVKDDISSKASADDVAALEKNFKELSAKIEDLSKQAKQPDQEYKQRPPSDGTGDHAMTDC